MIKALWCNFFFLEVGSLGWWWCPSLNFLDMTTLWWFFECVKLKNVENGPKWPHFGVYSMVFQFISISFWFKIFFQMRCQLLRRVLWFRIPLRRANGSKMLKIAILGCIWLAIWILTQKLSMWVNGSSLHNGRVLVKCCSHVTHWLLWQLYVA